MVDGKQLFEQLALPKDDCDAMLRVAVDCYGAGDLQKAETILVGLMALDERDPRPVKLLGSVLLLQDRHREAEQAYELAHALEQNDPYTLVALAEIKLKALKLDEAIPLFEALFAMDPGSKHPAANRGRQLIRTFHEKLSQGR